MFNHNWALTYFLSFNLMLQNLFIRAYYTDYYYLPLNHVVRHTTSLYSLCYKIYQPQLHILREKSNDYLKPQKHLSANSLFGMLPEHLKQENEKKIFLEWTFIRVVNHVHAVCYAKPINCVWRSFVSTKMIQWQLIVSVAYNFTRYLRSVIAHIVIERRICI